MRETRWETWQRGKDEMRKRDEIREREERERERVVVFIIYKARSCPDNGQVVFRLANTIVIIRVIFKSHVLVLIYHWRLFRRRKRHDDGSVTAIHDDGSVTTMQRCVSLFGQNFVLFSPSHDRSWGTQISWLEPTGLTNSNLVTWNHWKKYSSFYYLVPIPLPSGTGKPRQNIPR